VIAFVNRRWRRWFAAAAACLTLASPLGAQDPPEWSRPTEPFRIVGNVYWVGTYDLSSYLITSPEGHIVINTGVRDSIAQIRANIEALGFRISDVKILTATHAHWDHVAGLAGLKKLTGARVYLSAPDADVLESGGKSDFRWGKDPQAWFDGVAVDRRLADGETITLGPNVLTIHLHAGHSKGASSFTFTVRDGKKDYRVGIVNMGSINPGVRVSGMPGFPDIADAYARTFAAQKAMVLDVFLASHASQFGMHRKRRPGDAYDPDRFVDPKGFRAAVDELEAAFKKQLATERRQP
jgi:metallo-beta-lactamase class B